MSIRIVTITTSIVQLGAEEGLVVVVELELILAWDEVGVTELDSALLIGFEVVDDGIVVLGMVVMGS